MTKEQKAENKLTQIDQIIRMRRLGDGRACAAIDQIRSIVNETETK